MSGARQFTDSVIAWIHAFSRNEQPSFSYKFFPGHHSRNDFSHTSQVADLGNGALADFLLSSASAGSPKHNLRCASNLGWLPIRSRYESKDDSDHEVGGGSGAGFQIYCGDSANAPLLFSSGGGGGGGFSTGHSPTIGGGGGGGSSTYLPTSNLSKPWTSDRWMQFSNGGGQGCGTGHPYEINCGVQLDDDSIPPGRLSNEVSRAFKDMLTTCVSQVGLFVSGGGGGGGGGVGANHTMRFQMGYGFSFSALFCPVSSKSCMHEKQKNSMGQWSRFPSERRRSCEVHETNVDPGFQSGQLDTALLDYTFDQKVVTEQRCQFLRCPSTSPLCSMGSCSKTLLSTNSDSEFVASGTVSTSSCLAFGRCSSGLFCTLSGKCQPKQNFVYKPQSHVKKFSADGVFAPSDVSLDKVLRATLSKGHVQNVSTVRSHDSRALIEKVSEHDPIQGYLFEGVRECPKGYVT